MGVIEKLTEFRRGEAIMAGDFNLGMEPGIDSMSPVVCSVVRTAVDRD